MRNELIEEMYKELSGPRNGSEELIHGNPYTEYVTGVITPRKTILEEKKNPDAEMMGPSGEDLFAEDEIPDIDTPSSIPSELNAKRKPSSFGISFVVRGDSPSFNICVTWGRYQKEESNDDDNIWKRKPYYWVDEITMTEENKRLTIEKDEYGEIFIDIRKIDENEESSTIILILVNDLGSGEMYGEKLTENCIFQPSIRIKLKDKTQIGEISYPGERDRKLHYLYREKHVHARGHMCSAIWNEIDYFNHLDACNLWPDIYHFGDCHEFIETDIRTEFIPFYLITAPILNWNDEYGESPELSTSRLSEMWEENEVERNLSPFITAYERWIDENRNTVDITEENTEIIESLIENQEETLQRIKRGIEIIKKDKNARLSFCFANKVIFLQNKWKSENDDFRWKPFQLAFILMTLESIWKNDSDYRNHTDLLWIPTGGGKTEAYLGIMAFVMAMRRRVFGRNRTGGGTAVLTRYTLRLLTIQQFRRTLRMVTAAEYLRVERNDRGIGWRPGGCDIEGDWIFGSVKFSIGLWVGGKVTPNHLRHPNYGAIKILSEHNEISIEGEPAQVIRCPVCDSWLNIPHDGIPSSEILYLIMKSEEEIIEIQKNLSDFIEDIDEVKSIEIIDRKEIEGYITLKIRFNEQKKLLSEREIDELGKRLEERTSLKIIPFRASKPGYFGYGPEPGRRSRLPTDFEIYCPNPDCLLNSESHYSEGVPLSMDDSSKGKFPDNMVERRFKLFPEGSRIPIPAYTVDEQVYHRCPTIIISTADKIARLAFEPRTASIFGNVEQYNIYYGYCRKGLGPQYSVQTAMKDTNNIDVEQFSPPDLIVQDELHLMEGPLGSLFGLYESIVEALMIGGRGKPKYIASTATIKDAESQVKCLFARNSFQFPPYGMRIEDSFFVRYPEWKEGWNENNEGRIYMGVYAPGWGPHTPSIRIWSRLLKTCNDYKNTESAKYFWTVVGFFNAIRELGGGESLYREDVNERLNQISGENSREIGQQDIIELSSRIKSTDIPQILEELINGVEKKLCENKDAIFTTTMFGTGIDIPHLSLMIVHGQPKTTSQYIQTTGRVGRSHGGLVITFLRAGRPRDLSHYEMFTSYHHRIYLDVEPSSVSPFSDGCLARGSGPAMVSYFRNKFNPHVDWNGEDEGNIILEDSVEEDFEDLLGILSERIKFLEDNNEKMKNYFISMKERWQNIARRLGKENLVYVEYTSQYQSIEKNVVLGDPAHEYDEDLITVYKNAPQSLREIEETTSFGV